MGNVPRYYTYQELKISQVVTLFVPPSLTAGPGVPAALPQPCEASHESPS